MSEKKSRSASDADPFQVWREWVDRAERQLNASLAELMETERFGKSTGLMLELMMGFQSAMSSATERYFSTLNVPTRTDVLQIGERLASIEERLARLEQAVVALGPVEPRRPAPAAPRPERTRRPPGAEAKTGESRARPAAGEAPSSKKASSKKAARKKAAREKSTRSSTKPSR